MPIALEAWDRPKVLVVEEKGAKCGFIRDKREGRARFHCPDTSWGQNKQDNHGRRKAQLSCQVCSPFPHSHHASVVTCIQERDIAQTFKSGEGA